MPKQNHLPSYRFHKRSGQAVVTLCGRDIYLGPHKTQLSRDAYDRHVSEWLASGRVVPRQDCGGGLTVADLCLAYHNSGEVPLSHECEFRSVMKLWVRLYGPIPIESFGPVALKVVRSKLVEKGLKRATVNIRISQLRRIVRWGVSQQLVAPDILEALRAVEGLRQGQTIAPESAKVRPVLVEHVNACLAAFPPMLATMVRIQLLTGMRAKELCCLRTGDLDTSGDVWIYRPGQHKTQHHGHIREIALGQQAIELIRPWMLIDLQAIVFTPARAEQERRARIHAARRTPLTCGSTPDEQRAANYRLRLGDVYKTKAYARAIERAIDKAFPPPADFRRLKGETPTQLKVRLGPATWAAYRADRKQLYWTPHRLRHTFGQRVRDLFGLEHTQRALGHAHAKITEVYAQAALVKAVDVARAIG